MVGSHVDLLLVKCNALLNDVAIFAHLHRFVDCKCVTLIALPSCTRHSPQQESKSLARSDAMFAAVTRGHGKGQLATILGARKMRDLCDELEESNSFSCKNVWATGACGQVPVPAIDLTERLDR